MAAVDKWVIPGALILLDLDNTLFEAKPEYPVAHANWFHDMLQKSVQFDNQYYVLAQMKLLEKLDLLVGLAVARRTNLALFESLLLDCKMSWMELFKQYTGKNVLNVFRQDHGYKAGSYIKIWDGREDNEHLVEVLDIVDLSSGNIRDELYRTLKARYSMVLEGQ